MKQILFLTIFFALFMPCLAQNISAKVKGIVVDPKDHRVAGISITFQKKQFQKVVTSNAEGEYNIELPVGAYFVKVQNTNFREYRVKLPKLVANEMRTLDIRLKLLAEKMQKCPKGSICL
jgi:hypothetical protein